MDCRYNLQGVKEGIPDCVMGGGLLGLLRVSVAWSTSTGSSERTSPYTAALADAWSKGNAADYIQGTHMCTCSNAHCQLKGTVLLWKPTDTRVHAQIIHMQALVMTPVPSAFKDACILSLSNSLPSAVSNSKQECHTAWQWAWIRYTSIRCTHT